MVLGEASSVSSNTTKSKHSSSSHRKSLSHVSATVPADVGRTTAAATNVTATATTADESGLSVMKSKNVCIVEPQSTNKATAVVAPLMAESKQFTKLFGEPIVKNDVSRKHQHHKVSLHLALFVVECLVIVVINIQSSSQV